MGGVDPLNRSVTEALGALRMQAEAGVTLSRSLRTSGGVCRPVAARRAFSEAADRVEHGRTFEDALDALGLVLSYPERTLIAAGWHGGQIDRAIQVVTRRREVLLATRKKVRAQMLLPAFLFVAACLITPLPGLILNGDATKYLTTGLTPLAVALAVYAFFRLLRSASDRQWRERGISAGIAPATLLDRFTLALPVVGSIRAWRNRADFATLMAGLLSAGVGVIESLKLCARSLPSGVYRAAVMTYGETIERDGVPLMEAMNADVPRLWPRDWEQMLEVATQTGEEEQTLARLGEAARARYLDSVRVMGTVIARGFYLLVSLFIVFQIFTLFSGVMEMRK
jgi:type II secretory pathway component PulF